MNKKIAAVILSCILAYSFSCNYFAEEDTEENNTASEETASYNGIPLETIIITDENIDISNSPFVNADLSGSENSAAEYNHKSTLTAIQQLAYDVVLENISIDAIDGDNQIIIGGTVSGSLTGKSSLANVIWALYRDNPNLYWFNTTTIRAGSTYNSEKNTTEFIYILYTLGSKSEIEEYMSAISAVEDSVITVCSSFEYDYSKVKYIHDVVCDMADYDDDTYNYYISTGNILSGNPFSPVGVFVDGSAVCQGYALAVKLLCDDIGINCIYQSGTTSGGNHAWNFIEMEDSYWYGVDATWDGQDSTTSYNYFLLGTENFNTRHKYTNSIGVTLSGTDYVFSGTEETTGETATSTETTTETITETTTEAAAEATTELYSGLVGDIDNNGILTANDAACLLNYVLNNEIVSDSWNLSIDVSDVNQDGQRTAADVSEIFVKVLNSAYEYNTVTEEEKNN